MTYFPEPEKLEKTSCYPDPFRFSDGSLVGSKDGWTNRAEEISLLYQHYMYGVYRDGSDEELSYSYENGSLTLNIERLSTGALTSFKATVKLPDSSLTPPEGGYPVIVGMHQHISEDRAIELGFAVITIDGFSLPVASDNTLHQGAFYDLYPYSDDPAEQTGVLMAWGWGCSKIIDALEKGLAGELYLSAVNTVVTGVSRWGKAALVCGAFDKRFRMVAPSCSGAGGAALYRYKSEGKTYDFSSKGVEGGYTYGQNEPLSCLQSDGERGWFNDRFVKFPSPESLPVEQYMLCSLIADPKRLLFIIGSCISEDWVNSPAMWHCYLGAREVYKSLGIEDNIAVNIHKEGHAVIPEDIDYIVDFLNSAVYGTPPKNDLSAIRTSVFALPQNADESMNGFTDWWKKI